ncbi:MAG: sulfotransferase, partial [Henriciella sp.]
EYVRLMQHWARTLPATAYKTITYEDLVQAPESTARELVAHCGLPWDDRCMEFHKSKRSVKTASLTQVRQPIYNSSINNWRHYEHHLEGLKTILTDQISNK